MLNAVALESTVNVVQQFREKKLSFCMKTVVVDQCKNVTSVLDTGEGVCDAPN
jgi:hypothetical protein